MEPKTSALSNPTIEGATGLKTGSDSHFNYMVLAVTPPGQIGYREELNIAVAVSLFLFFFEFRFINNHFSLSVKGSS